MSCTPTFIKVEGVFAVDDNSLWGSEDDLQDIINFHGIWNQKNMGQSSRSSPNSLFSPYSTANNSMSGSEDPGTSVVQFSLTDEIEVFGYGNPMSMDNLAHPNPSSIGPSCSPLRDTAWMIDKTKITNSMPLIRHNIFNFSGVRNPNITCLPSESSLNSRLSPNGVLNCSTTELSMPHLTALGTSVATCSVPLTENNISSAEMVLEDGGNVHMIVQMDKEPVVRKGKRGRDVLEDKAHWSNNDKKTFLDICIQQVHLGNRPNSSFNKDGWQEIAESFNQKRNTKWNIQKFKSLYRDMRGSWFAWNHLCKRSDGWGWCHEEQKVDTPPIEHWNDFVKKYKHGTKFKREPFMFEKECVELFGDETSAKGIESCCPDQTNFPSSFVEQVVESHLFDNSNATQPYTQDDDNDSLHVELESAHKKQKKATGSGKWKQKKDVPLDAKETRTVIPRQDIKSVTLAMGILQEMKDVTSNSDLYIEAMQVLEDPVKRTFFILMDPHIRLGWLQVVISKNK